MTFVDSVKTCFAKYVDFNGRASRSEYWWFALCYVLAYIALVGLVAVIGSAVPLILLLGFVLPLIAAMTRRLHDTDRSGWWQLIGFVPLIGLALIVFAVLEGTPGDNKYGAPPAN
jgi:uncharacterized membrane protein YhaH (DUF805 family)